MGGLPSVAGYVRDARAGRPDTILLDAGDVLNKGDWVAWATRGEIMYRAMNKIGYTAGTPGNHEFVYGLEQLMKNASIAEFPLLCVNAVRYDGTTLGLPRSLLVDADGVTVGITGFTLPGADFKTAGCRSFSLDKTIEALAGEVAELDRKAQIVIAAGHFPNAKCSRIAKAIPAIDIFVAGHSHQALQQPKIVGAADTLIVQAGSNAGYVGHLEITVDLETGKILAHQYRLARLDNDTAAVDTEMVRWIRQVENEICPEAGEELGQAGRAVKDRQQLAKLYARAMREMTDTDAALTNPRRVLEGFRAGQKIDRNAVFRTHMMDGRGILTVQLSGALLRDFLGRIGSARNCQWDGFSAKLDFKKPVGKRLVQTDLDPERQYRVVMHDDLPARFGGRIPADSIEKCDFSATEALENYITLLSGQKLRVGPVR